MAFRYEDVTQWLKPLLPIQRSVKQFVTVEQCRIAWGLASKGATHNRLQELIKRGMAERVKVGRLYHYHLVEEQ